MFVMFLPFCLRKYDMYLAECSIGMFLGVYSKVLSVWHPLSYVHFSFFLTTCFLKPWPALLTDSLSISFTFGAASSQNACKRVLHIFPSILIMLFRVLFARWTKQHWVPDGSFLVFYEVRWQAHQTHKG